VSDILNFDRDERRDLSDFNCRWWCGVEADEHMHRDYYEVAIVAEGEQTNTVSGIDHIQRVGDVIIIKPGITHKIETNKENPAKLFNIAVRREYFDNFLRSKPLIEGLLTENDSLFIHLDAKAYAYVTEICAAVNNDRYTSLSYTLVESTLYALATQVMLTISESDMPTRGAAYYCKDAINKINNYTYIGKKVTEIYSLYPISHTAFIAEFKRITGKTLVSFLSERKLSYAKNLLLNSEMSIAEIASILGYDSVSHFIRLFRATYSKSPLKFRKDNCGIPPEQMPTPSCVRQNR